jgi:molybdopterin synthase catalytic subunit
MIGGEGGVPVRVVARFFASQREKTGTDRREVDLPEGARLADLVERVVRDYPALGASMGAARFAVNREYAPATTILHDRDEVAFIPPVAGGTRGHAS